MIELISDQVLIAKKNNFSNDPFIHFNKNCEYKIAKICNNKIAIFDENRKKVWFTLEPLNLGNYIWYWFRRKD